ncbi:hepatocyte growth factor activator [Chanos chanos]|uniref:trypsin n=1 Tax=Chanos chanos TaxID=29144 RepID=A0A6J2VQS5_CHACN|nr:hepatocyte growth factor activator [Chanos chanos]
MGVVLVPEQVRLRITWNYHNEDTGGLFTTDGKECKFPFRLHGRIYQQCINTSSNRTWCSLTHNFDRDLLWGYCVPQNRLSRDLCGQNVCENGGVCIQDPHRSSFECVCAEGFTGPHCEMKKCYEPIHLRHYDIGESWGRIHLRNVEQCTCVRGQISCERTRYTLCRTNPCENDGACRMIEATGEEVCYCRPGYSGPLCSFMPDQHCYKNTAIQYRGTMGTTLSGAHCLPWNSELLFDEVTVNTVESAPAVGLGEHAYCRNPDEDRLPWCYTLSDGAISWEHCDVPSCLSRLFSRRVPSVVPQIRPSIRKRKGRVCGRRHKKRVPRGRILGGSSALPGAHPWIAALYIGDEFCAGSLVSACWVVSAAHCFIRNPLISKVRVVLGQHFFNDTGRNTRHFGIEKYVFPRRYSQYNPTVHDIVLVKLKKKDGHCARRSQFIQPICLPETNTTFPDYSCCTIAGWGHTEEKSTAYSHLREGIVQLIPYDKCSAPDVYGSEIRTGMLCAGINNCVDACQGDSGGPLACVKDGLSVLYGVISWGDGCGRSGKPGVYTRVPSYVSWIKHIIKRKKIHQNQPSL